MLARRVFAVAIAFGAVQGTSAEDAEDEKVTCKFTMDLGTSKLHCAVPGAMKKCCAMQQSIDKCMKEKEQLPSCYENAFKDNGFDEKKIKEDPNYIEKECPVLSALKSEEDSEKYCKVEKGEDIKIDPDLLEKVECSLADGPKGCDIPGVKRICCKLAKAMLPCQVKGKDEVSCQTAAFTNLMPELLAAGVDMQAAEDMDYWDKFCPILSKFFPPSAAEEKKYCHSADDSKLFSIKLKKGFSFVKKFPVSNEGSVAPIVAMAALGVAFAVVLFGIATKRMVSAHTASEVELEPVLGEESLIA